MKPPQPQPILLARLRVQRDVGNLLKQMSEEDPIIAFDRLMFRIRTRHFDARLSEPELMAIVAAEAKRRRVALKF